MNHQKHSRKPDTKKNINVQLEFGIPWGFYRYRIRHPAPMSLMGSTEYEPPGSKDQKYGKLSCRCLVPPEIWGRRYHWTPNNHAKKTHHHQNISKIFKNYQNNHKQIQTIPNPSKSQTIPKQSQQFPKHPKPSKHIQTIPNPSKPNVSGPAAGTRKAWKMLLCMLLGLEPSYCQNLCNTSTVCERKSHEKLKIGTGQNRKNW